MTGITDTCKVIRTKSRGQINMFCLGSTIGAARYPLFVNPLTSSNSMLPRPVVNSRPGGLSYVLFQTSWFIELSKTVEKYLFDYLGSLESSDRTTRLLQSINFCKKIPLSLRVCETIFHQVFIVTNNKELREIMPHKDQNDLINCLLTIGIPKSGADLIFFPSRKRKEIEDDSNESKIMRIPWKHGNLIIGNFNEVLHAVSKWEGNLFFLNFTIKIPILKHFQQFGTSYYKQYEDKNYPNKYFIAK